MPYTDLDFKNTTLGRKELSKGEKSQKLDIIFNCARNDVDAGSWVAQKKGEANFSVEGSENSSEEFSLGKQAIQQKGRGAVTQYLLMCPFPAGVRV